MIGYDCIQEGRIYPTGEMYRYGGNNVAWDKCGLSEPGGVNALYPEHHLFPYRIISDSVWPGRPMLLTFSWTYFSQPQGLSSGAAPLYSLNGIQRDLGGLRGAGVDISSIANADGVGGHGLSWIYGTGIRV